MTGKMYQVIRRAYGLTLYRHPETDVGMVTEKRSVYMRDEFEKCEIYFKALVADREPKLK